MRNKIKIMRRKENLIILVLMLYFLILMWEDKLL